MKAANDTETALSERKRRSIRAVSPLALCKVCDVKRPTERLCQNLGFPSQACRGR
jgi:hypothetical protein